MNDSLERVNELFRQRSDAALERFGAARQKQSTAAASLERVQSLGREYRAQLAEEASDGMTTLRLKQWQHFLGGIGRGERQQDALLQAFAQHTAAAEQQFHAARAKAEAIAVLRERRTLRESVEAVRREQRLNDEFAARVRLPGQPGTA